MDLLGNETKKEQQPKGKKIVLMLLILSIVMLIVILALLVYLKDKQVNPLTLNINNKKIELKENVNIVSENNLIYLSIKEISNELGYNYSRGEYLQYVEDNNKCYIEKDSQIIGFESGSNKIYKTSQNAKTDYEYYDLKNKIIEKNGILYISLEDIPVGCSCIVEFKTKENEIIITSAEKLFEIKKESFLNQGLTISEDASNKRAMIYDMFIAANENGKLGVLDSNLNSIIGHKYETMEFDEFTKNFIVSSDNKYGIITRNGNIVIDLRLDEIKIINYNPLLYSIKLNNKYGIINGEGKVVTNIEYDKIGFLETSSTIEPTLLIKNINNQNGLVVCKNGKYGVIDLETGTTIINCELEKIYSETNLKGQKKYYIELQSTKIELDRYIEFIKQKANENQ